MHSELTFIILARTSDGELATSDIPNLPMIGDVNIFFNGAPGDQGLESEAEIMIAGELALWFPFNSPACATSKLTKPMHGFFRHSEPGWRRKGLAIRALQLMFSYATGSGSPSPLPVLRESLVARIGDQNGASIALFQKLGFEIIRHVDVFSETEMRYTGKGVSSEWLVGEQRHYD